MHSNFHCGLPGPLWYYEKLSLSIKIVKYLLDLSVSQEINFKLVIAYMLKSKFPLFNVTNVICYFILHAYTICSTRPLINYYIVYNLIFARPSDSSWLHQCQNKEKPPQFIVM